MKYAPGSAEIRFRAGKKRRNSLWAPTLFQWDCRAFAKRQSMATFWSCPQSISVAPFRQGSTGECPDASADPIDFAKVLSCVLQ